MKTSTWILAAALVAAIAAGGRWYPVTAAEEEVRLQDLPPAVRTAIEQQAAGGRIVEIEKETKRGEVLFEAEVMKGGREIEILVSAAGKVLGQEMDDEDDDGEDDDDGDDDDERVVFRDLPDAVQNTLNNTYAGIQFGDFSKDMEDGHTVYETSYKEDGVEREMALTADGYVLEVEEEVGYDALPPAVQLLLDTKYAGGKIDEMERVQVTFYEVELEMPDGTEVEVKVLADGRLIGEDDTD